jgi:hypothetical protein
METMERKKGKKAEGLKKHHVYLNLTGRHAGTYESPQAFVEEAQRLGVSRKIHAIVAVPGDVIMFVVAPHRLKKERGVTFHPHAFGYCIVTGYAIYPKTPMARVALTNALKGLVEQGVATVVEEADMVVTRRCGYYRIGRRVEIKDWGAFEQALLQAWRNELHTLPEDLRKAHYLLRDFDFLVQGQGFKQIDPPLELPLEMKFKRGLRLVKPDELELLLAALRRRLDEAAIDAILTDKTDQPAILLELTEYVQQAMNKPAGTRQRRRRKVKEQPTHIPEPEPTPLSALSEPEPLTQPEPQHPISNCVKCGKPTDGKVLCEECKRAVLKNLGVVATS